MNIKTVQDFLAPISKILVLFEFKDIYILKLKLLTAAQLPAVFATKPSPQISLPIVQNST